MNLFVIYVGGKHTKSLLELHDMRFVLADRIEDTYRQLRESWWGEPKSLHLDCWGILKSADGYNIHLKNEPSVEQNKLFFINLGGYDSTQFTELHKNVFVVAPNEREAKLKALQQIKTWESPHRDYLYDIENIINIENAIG